MRYLAIACALLFANLGYAAADTWRGTAPFCAGECNKGEVFKGSSKCGEGGCCWTGSKALCGNASPQCHATSTKADCYGVVMICQNGFNHLPDNVWNTCDSYACGACIGFGDTGDVSLLSVGGHKAGYAPGTCNPGFVWREASPSDKVCVPPAERDAARADNAAADSRRSPNGGASGPTTCKSGFVWREAFDDDHVCVVPQARDQARQQNQLADSRRVSLDVSYRPVVCKTGFVWREAIKNDHVCVTPPTRAAARADNAAAAGRRKADPQFGPDACQAGFVWREVIPTDHVCVTPATRGAVVADNAEAPARRQ